MLQDWSLFFHKDADVMLLICIWIGDANIVEKYSNNKKEYE